MYCPGLFISLLNFPAEKGGFDRRYSHIERIWRHRSPVDVGGSIPSFPGGLGICKCDNAFGLYNTPFPVNLRLNKGGDRGFEFFGLDRMRTSPSIRMCHESLFGM